MPYRFAVDIGATRTVLALIDAERPDIIAFERPESDFLFTGWRPPARALSDAITEVLRAQGVEPGDLLGIGIGIPGIVDRKAGRVISCPNLSVLDGAELGAELGDDLGVQVCMDNNTNLISLGEHTAGLGRDVDCMAVIFVGIGVGCGLIINGELYEGADGAAGEFGHTNVVPNGLPCTCGAHGCLEMYCSGKALARVAQQIFPPREMYTLGTRFGGAQLLTEQAREGNPKAIEALRDAFTYLGIGLTSLANLLNPRLIVLGGGVLFAFPEGIEIARSIVQREALPAVRRDLRIEVSQLGNFAGVLGGAAMVSAACRLHRR